MLIEKSDRRRAEVAVVKKNTSRKSYDSVMVADIFVSLFLRIDKIVLKWRPITGLTMTCVEFFFLPLKLRWCFGHTVYVEYETLIVNVRVNCVVENEA